MDKAKNDLKDYWSASANNRCLHNSSDHRRTEYNNYFIHLGCSSTNSSSKNLFKCSANFYWSIKTTQPRPRGFSINVPLSSHYPVLLTSFSGWWIIGGFEPISGMKNKLFLFTLECHPFYQLVQHTLRVTGPGLLPRKVRMKILHRLVIKAKNNVFWLYSD